VDIEKVKSQKSKVKMKYQKSKIILHFTLLFCILIFAFCILASKASAANGSLYLAPSSGTYTVGNTFSVSVMVNTGGVSINAAQGTLTFSPDKLSVTGISKGGSVFSLWTAEPTYSNSSGTISFGGGIPNPGYTGASGKIITITFKARVSGTAPVSWSSGAVLANDGKGTNILASMGGGNYTLKATTVSPPAEPLTPPARTPTKPDISSSTHSEEDKWHSDSTVKFSWTLPEGATGTSILFNQQPVSDPGPLSDGLFDTKIYDNVSDGIWYLHLKLRNKYGWGIIKHFRVQVDTTAPHPFDIKIKEGKETDNPQPTLLFESKDDVSGIDHYEVRTDGEEPAVVTPEEMLANPYKMPIQPPGKHMAIVEALDKAGNSTVSTTEVNILSIESPKINKYPQRLSLGDTLILEGTSLPNVTIKCYIQKEGYKAVVGETRADDNGNWVYVHDKSMGKGLCKIYAVAIDERGAQSYSSQEVAIAVTLPTLLKIGNIAIDYLTVVIVLLILIGLTIFGVYWGWHKFRLFRKRLRKETKEAKDALHKAFSLLREDITEQLRQLEKIRGKRKFTEKEKEVERQLKKDIDIAEKYIGKEVKDIEEELK